MLKKSLIIILVASFLNVFVCPFVLAKEVILESGTKIRLKTVDPISTRYNNEGDEVNFVVVEDIRVGDVVLIKEGSRATALISELTPRGRVGKSGKMLITLDTVRAVNGKRVPLTASITKKGEDKIVLSAALSFLVCPLFLLLRGKEAQIPQGYQVTSRVDRDVLLELDDNFVPVKNF